MLVAPLRFKSVLLEQMDRQIDRARRGLPASMILKNNSINDPQIINKISEASCAGVRVDMIVRGICCIKAGGAWKDRERPHPQHRWPLSGTFPHLLLR